MIVRWLLMIWLLSLLPAAAAHSATEAVSERVVRIAVPYDLPPLSYLSAETGEPTGWHVALWRRWAAVTGTEIRLLALDLSEALAALRSGEVDLISSLASPQAPDLLLSEPLSEQTASLIGRPGTPQGGRFGVIGYEYAAGRYAVNGRRLPYRYRGLGAMLRDFHEGALDGFYTTAPEFVRAQLDDADATVVRHIHSLPTKGQLDEPVSGHPQASVKMAYHVAGRRDHPALMARVNEGMAQIRGEGKDLQQIYQDWLKMNQATPGHYDLHLVNLTTAERRYLAEFGPVRVGYNLAGAPPYYQVVDGTPVGASVDLLKQIGRRTGLRFEPVLLDEWKDVVAALKTRRVALLAAAVKTPTRSGYAAFSLPYDQQPWMLIRRTGKKPAPGAASQAVDLQSLAGQTLALPAGFAINELLLNKVPDISVVSVADTGAALRAVADGRADATIHGAATARDVMLASGLPYLAVAPLKGASSEVHFAVSAAQPLLLSILNKALKGLPPHERMQFRHTLAPSTRFPQVVASPLSKYILLLLAVATPSLLILFIWNRRLLHEVRRRKRTEAKLHQTRQRAWDAANAKARFLAVMSHEIRTPLNGMLGMLELLERGELAPAQRQKLAVAQESSRSLLTIINDILEFSRLEAGKLQLDRQSVSIDAVVAPVFSTMAVSAQRKGLAFSTEIDPALQEKCYWLDPTRLRQVLFNLIGNAIKFTAEGKVQVTLGRSQEEGAESLQLQVLDTGIGIPKEKLASLFEAFEQAEISTSRVYGGSGLGLTISRSLVELMQGSLELESTAGLGARVSVRLPLIKACAYCLKKTCSFDATTSSDSTDVGLSFAEPMSQWAGHRLLLAEDHPVNRMVLLEQLQVFGVEVDVAVNGSEALELYQQQGYSLVLADCQMPVMDGFELAAALRQLQQLQGRRTPVIAITAHASEGIEQTCLDAGFTDVLSKPISLVQLEQLLERYLGDELPEAESVAGDLPLPPPKPASAPPPYQGNPERPPVLDLGVITATFGGNTPVQALLAAYLDSNGEDMHRLRQAADGADILAIRQAAHRLKGAARVIGATAFAEYCAEVEDTCYLGLTDIDTLAPLLDELWHQHALLLLKIESLELTP